MKKYVISLLFLIAQNMCAMELEQSSSQDAKALRFAKFFNKYPNGYGKNKRHICARKKKMNRLLKRVDLFSISVKKYQKELKNIEAKDLLFHLVRDKELPNEVKHKIFADVLWDKNKAGQYYAINNLEQFINVDSSMLNTHYLRANSYHHRYFRYFLSEINQSNDIVMMFSTSKVSKSMNSNGYTRENTELFIIYLNCRLSNQKEFYDLISEYKTIFIVGREIFLPSRCKEYSGYDCHFEKRKLEQLNFFLQSRYDRVAKFKKNFHDKISHFLITSDENNYIDAFIELMNQFKFSVPDDLKHLC